MRFPDGTELDGSAIVVHATPDGESNGQNLSSVVSLKTKKGHLVWHATDGTLTMRVELARPPVNKPTCLINGEIAGCELSTPFKTESDRWLVDVHLQAETPVQFGDRVCVQAEFAELGLFAGTVKAFSQLVCGSTQFDLVVRPVLVEPREQFVAVGLYNESDFRKPPVVIRRVTIDGNDVTRRCEIPAYPIPADRHHYTEDVRKILIPNSLVQESDRIYRVDLEFLRLEPQKESSYIPPDYYEPQTVSFGVTPNLPFAIDQEGTTGLRNGTCLYFAGLRPLPSPRELRISQSAVRDTAPGIPVFACVPMLEHREDFLRVFYENDFAIINDMSSRWRGAAFVQDFGGLGPFHPWALSCLVSSREEVRLDDLRWIAWTAIGLGSKGIMLSSSEPSELEDYIRRKQNVQKVINEIESLRPLLERSQVVSPSIECNQEGIDTKTIHCGGGRLLVIAINHWCSRGLPYVSLPSRFPSRTGVELSMDLGENWVPKQSFDPFTGHPVKMLSQPTGRIKLSLPAFGSVQLIQLDQCESGNRIALKTTKAPQPQDLIEILGSPIVDLGRVRPGSTHVVNIPIRSHFLHTVQIAPVSRGTGNQDFVVESNAGAVYAGPVQILAGQELACRITYKAPFFAGETFSEVKYELKGKDGDYEMPPMLVCCEVADPASLSKSLLDYGKLRVGDGSPSRRIDLICPYANAKIINVDHASQSPIHVTIAEDGQHLKTELNPSAIPTAFTTKLKVTIKIDEDDAPLIDYVDVRAEWVQPVTATPNRVVTTESEQWQRFQIRVEQLDGLLIKIESITAAHPALIVKSDSKEFASFATVSVELAPNGIAKIDQNVLVNGICQDGKSFEIEIPVKRISLKRKR